MRIFRYIVTEVVTRGGAALLLLVMIYLAIDFVESGDRTAATTYFLRLPMVVSHMIPIAMVLGVQASLAGLRARGEWNAFLAAGISPWVLGFYLLILPAALIPVQYVMQSVVVPRTLLSWRDAGGAAFEAGPTREGDGANRWCKKGDLLLEKAVGQRQGVVVTRDKNGSPIVWRGSGVAKGADGSTFEWRPLGGWSVSKTAEDGVEKVPCVSGRAYYSPISNGGLATQSFTSEELRGFLAAARGEGRQVPLETELALRIVLTLSCLVLPFLALTMTIRGYEPGHGKIIGSGLLAVFIFWLMLSVAWNGALAEFWAPRWVSIGVPFFSLVIGGVLVAFGKKLTIQR